MSIFSKLNSLFMFSSPQASTMTRYLSAADISRMKDYAFKQSIWRGNHWDTLEGMDEDKPKVTQNWTRRFSSKLCATEFKNGIGFKFSEEAEKVILPVLQEVWDDNNGEAILDETAQAKSITGDGYMLVEWEPKYEKKEGKEFQTRRPDFLDPFDIYGEGRIVLSVIPPTLCYPKWRDGYQHEMESCTIMFPVRKKNGWLGKESREEYTINRFVYYDTYIEYYEGDDLKETYPNALGIIPIVHFKNKAETGRHFGISDLDDLIPLNIEHNIKSSDISQIIDYHASPVTIVTGARVKDMERGANKTWSFASKEAKVTNLEMRGDLAAATNYNANIMSAMHAITGVTELSLGVGAIPANISSIALSILLGPLVEVIEEKRKQSEIAIRMINKLIIKIAIREGLIVLPPELKGNNKLIYNHDVIWGSILPKDAVQMLEEIQQKMKMGLTTRKQAMKDLKQNDVENLLEEAEEEMEEHPSIHGITPIVLSPGQKLINPYTGEVIAESEPLPTAISPSGGGGGEVKNDKPVGSSARSDDLKVISGNNNKNPGKSED